MKILFLIVAFCMIATMPRAALAITENERAAYILLLIGPKDNPVKSCASSALQLNTGLTAKIAARSSDENVEKDLMANVTTDALRAERVREVELWKKTHSAAKVAHMNFDYCAQQSNVDLHADALKTTCFSFAGVPALAEAMKGIGQPKDTTAEKVVRVYGKQIPEQALRAVVDDVYSHNAEVDNFHVHRQVFAECLRDTRRQVSDEEVMKEYERRKAISGDKDYRVMHIMVSSKEAADQLVARLNKGEAFADLALANSLDSGSSKKGGDLGWAGPHVYAPALAAAIVATAPGTYTTVPVHSPYGWHIVKVDGVRAMVTPTFEQVKEILRQSLESKPAPSE